MMCISGGHFEGKMLIPIDEIKSFALHYLPAKVRVAQSFALHIMSKAVGQLILYWLLYHGSGQMPGCGGGTSSTSSS
jgi:hypothetical protein